MVSSRLRSRSRGRARSRARSHRLRRPALAVGALQRPAGEVDPDRAGRLRRERQRPLAHHPQPGALGVRAVQQVEHDVGAEPGGGDAEPGVAERVGHPPAYAVPKNAVNRVQVSITPPQRWVKRSPSSCGNVSKKCSASSAWVRSFCSSAGAIRLP